MGGVFDLGVLGMNIGMDIGIGIGVTEWVISLPQVPFFQLLVTSWCL